MHWLQAFLQEIVRLSVWLAILATLFIPLERRFALRSARPDSRGATRELGLYFLNSLVVHFVIAVPMTFLALATRGAHPDWLIGFVTGMPTGLRLVLALLVSEIGAYWGHRLAHENAFLWRFHAVHHSPQHLHWLANTHAHPVDVAFVRLAGLTPLYALGLADGASGSLVPALVAVISTVWSFFLHANIRWRLGPLEKLVTTPAFHHWHHTNDAHINKNYASLLPFIDRLFGTHHLPAHWPSGYGLARTDTRDGSA